MNEFIEAVKLIKQAEYGVVFTGAGVSVESGIAPFTGQGGLWNQYDPKFIEINFFYSNPTQSWEEMKKIFFTDMEESSPNKAHEVIAKLEKKKMVRGWITQNIDGLNQIDPSLPIMYSPFLNQKASPEATFRAWCRFFKISKLRKGDIFCCQDSVGAGHFTKKPAVKMCKNFTVRFIPFPVLVAGKNTD